MIQEIITTLLVLSKNTENDLHQLNTDKFAQKFKKSIANIIQSKPREYIEYLFQYCIHLGLDNPPVESIDLSVTKRQVRGHSIFAKAQNNSSNSNSNSNSEKASSGDSHGNSGTTTATLSVDLPMGGTKEMTLSTTIDKSVKAFEMKMVKNKMIYISKVGVFAIQFPTARQFFYPKFVVVGLDLLPLCSHKFQQFG